MESGVAGSRWDVTVIVVMAMTSESFKGTSAGKQIKVIALKGQSAVATTVFGLLKNID